MIISCQNIYIHYTLAILILEYEIKWIWKIDMKKKMVTKSKHFVANKKS